MRIIRFTSAVSCGILRSSQRAFGTYLCVYREEDDHTTPDRKSSGWMILSAMWLRRTMFPAVEWVEDGRFFLFLLHAVRVKKCVAANGHAATHFLYALFCIFFCLPVIYIFAAYHPLIFTLACIPLFHRIQLFFPHISCPNTAASIVSSCAGPPIPPALSPPCSQRPRSSFASYVPSLVPLYLQLPSPRYAYSCPLPVSSQVGMQLPKASLLSALFAFCIVSPTTCLCPWIQIVYNV